MKKRLLLLPFLAMLFFISLSIPISAEVDETHPGFRVEGRFLYDNAGEKVILYGINKMIIWMDKDGDPSFSEIAKTGANSVRIVWTMDGTAQELDTAITNCRKEHMIPMVELHDATGEWSKLPSLVDYWVRDDVVEVIKKHQEYLLVNIGNEVGNSVSEDAFKAGYSEAVTRMREAGIHVPLIIDASSYGQDINILQSCGPSLIEGDPDRNLIFSVHMWWPYMYGRTDQEVVDEIAETVEMGLPLIVGEFGNEWEQTESGQIPYKVIIEQCYKNEIGYLPWSWGPGNNPQTFLDMTTDGTFATLQGWGLEVALNNIYSIQNIAQIPVSMLSDLPPVLPAKPLPYGNLAQGMPATSSSNESGYVAGNIVDSDLGTRWASEVSDPNWVYVDLLETKEIDRVIINWEAAYATQYKIQVSDDALTWKDIYTSYNGKGGTEDISVTGLGRYVRIYGSQRYNTSWPYSIYEIGIYGPESQESASISPSVAVFDKNMKEQSDVTITLSSKNNTLNAVMNGSTALVLGTDYTISGTTLTVKKEYLSDLAEGTTKLVLDYNEGVDPYLFIAIGDTSPSGYIRPSRVEFDRNETMKEDVVITMSSNNNTLLNINNGTTALVLGEDYTVSENTVTIKKEYLAKQDIKVTKLTFDFDKGTDPVLRVNVSDTTESATITPTSEEFEKRLQEDVVVTMTTNGNKLNAVMNGSVVLDLGTDYTVENNIVTISKEFLAKQEVGVMKLTFDFAAGIDPILSITVTDTAPTSLITPKNTSFDPESPEDIKVTMTLNGNTLVAIKNGTTALVNGTDYTVEENIVTILKTYIQAQTSESTSLTFCFSEGANQVLTINPPLPDAIPSVRVTTTNNTNSINQSYVITAKGGTIDLSKVSIQFSADGMSTEEHNVFIDNAALQLNVAPWYSSINSYVKGTVTNGVLSLSISSSTQLVEGTGSLTIDLRFAKVDWSNYGTLTSPVLNVYYDGILIQ